MSSAPRTVPPRTRRRPATPARLRTAALIAVAPTLFAPTARAVNRYWVGGTNVWTSNSWSAAPGGATGATAPTVGDWAVAEYNDAVNRTITFDLVPALNGLTHLRLDNTGAGNTAMSQAQGTFNVNGAYVGIFGNGSYALSAGASTVGDLRLGLAAIGRGAYTLSGTGALRTTTGLTIGSDGIGTFNQSGGTHTVASMTLASSSNATGTYTLTAGTLASTSGTSAGALYLGYGGTGTFNQSGGSVTLSTLYFGVSASGVGAYNLTGGTLTTNNQLIGYAGAGSVLHNGGTNTTNALSLGSSPAPGAPVPGGSYTLQSGALVVRGDATIGDGGTGAFTLTGGSVSVGGNEIVGNAGAGAFTQFGGTHAVAGTLTIANSPGSSGNFQLAGGSLTAATVVNNGRFEIGRGSFTGDFANNRVLAVTAPVTAFNGALTASANATTTVDAPVTVGAGVTNAGTIVVNTSGVLAAEKAGLLNAGGNINLQGGALAGAGPVVNRGTITGFGQITGGDALTNEGTITQGVGTLTFAKAAGALNNGVIALAPGQQLSLSTPLSNNATLDLAGATVSGPAPLINSAAGVIIGPGTLAAPLTNAGTILLPAGTLNLQQPLTSSGAIQLNAFTSHLVGNALTNTGTLQGSGVVSNALTNNGTIEAIGGTLSLTGPLTNNTPGILRAATGSKILATTGLATNAGVVSLAGGTFDNNGLPLTNTGQLSGFGTFATGGLTNNGAVFLTGGNTTVNGPVTNTAGKKISVRYNPALFTGPVVNAGTLEVIGTTATFAAGGPLPAPLPGAPALAASLPSGALDGAGTTTITSGGTIVADHVRQASLNVADGSVTLRPGSTHLDPAGTSVVNQLLLGETSTFDLANNALVVDYAGPSPLDDVRAYVLRAYHGGDWRGAGLTSSLIPTTRGGAIGYAEAATTPAAAGGTFAGQAVDATSILVRLTVAGDATLDGRVNFDDLLVLAKNYNRTATVFGQGDFTYDGRVNFDDLLVLAKNYNGVLAADPVPGATATFNADLSAAFAQVPEPSTLALAAACGFALSARRRSRRTPHR